MFKPDEKIIDDVLYGLASQDDAEKVAVWFSTTAGQEYLEERMKRDFDKITDSQIEDLMFSHQVSGELWNKIAKQTVSKKRNSSHLFLKIAAVLVPFFVLVSFFMLHNSHDVVEYAEIYVPKGGMREIVFDDGTRVFLNSDTKFSYPDAFSQEERRVKLEGEAYFEVEKDVNRPFIVEMKHASIKVLGTAFNVSSYAYDDKIDIALDNGRINIISSDGKEKYDLLPQERFLYNKVTRQAQVLKDENTLLASSWRNNMIIFEDAPLVDVLKTLSRYYAVEFEVKDKGVFNYSYTLTTERVLLEEILSDLEKISEVRFDYNENTGLIKVSL